MQRFGEYEKAGIGYYGSQTENKLALNQVAGQTVELALSAEAEMPDLGNPYKPMQSWISAEIQDLQAMIDCIQSVHRIDLIIKDLRGQIIAHRDHLQSVSHNKPTIKNVWLKLTNRQ